MPHFEGANSLRRAAYFECLSWNLREERSSDAYTFSTRVALAPECEAYFLSALVNLLPKLYALRAQARRRIHFLFPNVAMVLLQLH